MPIIRTDKLLKSREENDFYPTPLEFVEMGLSLLPAELTPMYILDPGAGSGVWGQAARKLYGGAYITGVELRQDAEQPIEYDWWHQEDFRLIRQLKPTFDLVMGNPPYRHTEAFIRQSMELLTRGGYLLFLLPLQFLAGQNRGRGLWRQYPPLQVTICSKRPSWTGDGKTDATDYAFFLWRKDFRGQPSLHWTVG